MIIISQYPQTEETENRMHDELICYFLTEQ